MRRVRERVDQMAAYCDTEVVLEIVGGKWKILIVKYLLRGTHRFNALQRALPPITQRMLTRQLRELEADGVVRRTVYAEVPPRVEYALTDVGRTLGPVVEQMDRWGHWYREHLRAEACGEPGALSPVPGRPDRPGSSGRTQPVEPDVAGPRCGSAEPPRVR